MVVAEVAKIDIVFFNQEEVVGEAYQSAYLQASIDQTTIISIEEQTLEASADQITVISIEEQTIEIVQTEVVISHQEEDVGEASQSKEEVEHNKEEVVEGKDDDDRNSQNKPDPEQLFLMESEVDVILKKRHALTKKEINEKAFKMACGRNQLHAHLEKLLPGVLLESFIQRPISQDEKNQVDQVWSLRKDELSLEANKDNRSTYMSIGEETVCLNTLYTLYPKQWLDNEVIDVYIKSLIQYFDTQHRARLNKEWIVLADVFACQYIGRAFNV
ncbi:hypothetical protein GIB67_035834 [Kingdonia uniflora]|uniref:Uncharacterized protein n=1 Tax=Kingdonia uniflora TaxID=39325 RepID=A0A7J7MJP7_9MAGN|nr:hypothetical protein GIB67_035834 [Kingdonia uniflora]